MPIRLRSRHYSRATGASQGASGKHERSLADDQAGWNRVAVEVHPAGTLQSRAIGQLRQQAQDFQVQPDQRDHQAECAVPFHVLGRLGCRGLLDEVEVQQQVERRQADHEQAEADPHAESR